PAFSQHPCGIRILEPVHDVSEHVVILFEKIRPLMIPPTRSRSIRKSLIEIRIAIVPISAEAACRIVSTGGSAKLRQQSHRQKCNALVVHRLVIAAFRSDELTDGEHVIER